MTALTMGMFSCTLLLAICSLSSCSQDDGNYEYLPDEEVSKIELEVDTTITKNGAPDKPCGRAGAMLT